MRASPFLRPRLRLVAHYAHNVTSTARRTTGTYHATLLPHDASILKHGCMSEIRHHKPQQRLGLHVPPRYDLLHKQKHQHARLATRANWNVSSSRKTTKHVQSRSRPCFKQAMRNTTRTQLKCATPHLMADSDGILKARCISEIWHHKPKRTICLGVPCRFTPSHDKKTARRASQIRSARKGLLQVEAGSTPVLLRFRAWWLLRHT